MRTIQKPICNLTKSDPYNQVAIFSSQLSQHLQDNT